MPAKKIRSAPGAALLSDTALSVAPPFDAVSASSDGDLLSGGLLRTLARSRDGLETPANAKASALAKLAKSDKSGRGKPAPAVRKSNIGPRSGHK